MKLDELSPDDAAYRIVGQAVAKSNTTYVWVTKNYSGAKEAVKRLNKHFLNYWAKYSASDLSFSLPNGSRIRVQDAQPERLCGFSLDGAVISRWCDYEVAIGIATCLTRTKGWMYKVAD